MAVITLFVRQLLVIGLFFIVGCSNEKDKNEDTTPDGQIKIDSLNKQESSSLIKYYHAIENWPYHFTMAMRDNLIDSLVAVTGIIEDLDRVQNEEVLKIISIKPSYIANIYLNGDQLTGLLKDIPQAKKTYKGCFIFKVMEIDNNLEKEEDMKVLKGSLVDFYIYKKDE